MSLNFGYSKETESAPVMQPVQKKVLNYVFHYKAISKKLNVPHTLVNGHPYNVMFCNAQLNKDASFTILSHTFDVDDTITTLKLRHILVVYKLDGTTDTVNLADVDYGDSNLIKVSKTNSNIVYFLGDNYKFKDVYSDYRFMIGFEINFKQISNENYGNESTMNIVVDF